MRPSLSRGAYSVERSFPVTTIGTRRSGFSSARYVSVPTHTRSGWSQMFISVPTTICELTVFCVDRNTPAPASTSFITRHDNTPVLLAAREALR